MSHFWQNISRWFSGFFHGKSSLTEYEKILADINEKSDEIAQLTDEALQKKTLEFRERMKEGETLDDLLVEAFAVVRETSWRVLKMRHFDVQILGGIALHKGDIIEMKTGEGKTLVATLPAYLNALTGKGVHVITVNDYLAQRDAEWMGKIYRFLGLEVGVVLESMDKDEEEDLLKRQRAYAADITYLTNHEAVFDYLRDNLAKNLNEIVQRGQHYAIIDEVDLLLIDEVRTPLIISGSSNDDVGLFEKVDTITRRLKKNEHYKVDLKSKTAALTEKGIDFVEKELKIGSLADPQNVRWYHAIHQSVLAHGAYHKDVDYLVKDGEIQLIDEYTGRVSPDKRFAEGLHQALEAKEGIEVRPEDRTFARMSYQNYFRLYEKLSGMTGTAWSEREEFRNIYGMDVKVIPTHKEMIRIDYEDAVFLTLPEKHEAILSEVKMMRKEGRPILIGTSSVKESEKLARRFKKAGIPCQVLNAKNHEKEADIIAQAGRYRTVTISTNMAGRGTDILLGGNPEKLAEQKARKNPKRYEEFLEKFRRECQEDREKVIRAGGLHVIGTSLHEASRLDNQLRGRAGRQGDVGSSQFIISLEDEIFLKYGEREIDELFEIYEDSEEGTEITNPSLLKTLEKLRQKVEIEYRAERMETFKYDLIVSQQREHIYQWRSELLHATKKTNAEKKQLIMNIIDDVLEEFIQDSLTFSKESSEILKELDEHFREVFGEKIPLEHLPQSDNLERTLFDELKKVVLTKRQKALEHSDESAFYEMELSLLLEVIDTAWIDHLSQIEKMEDGLDLVGYGQLDPLVIFRKEVGLMYENLIWEIKREAVKLWFSLSKVRKEEKRENPVKKQGKKRKRG